MNEQFLKKYLSEEDIKTLLNKLHNKQRANILNDKYFIKIGKNIDKLFYDTLVKEINLYNLNMGNPNFPKIIDSYIDDNICILVLEKINGHSLGVNRNDFDISITDEERKKIIEQIKTIKDIQVNMVLANDYSRSDKLSKYFERSMTYLDEETIEKIKNKFNYISSSNGKNVISHGDLICPNIMLLDNNVFFIDWEFISYKPESYDVAYFMLFSKEENCFSYIDEINCEKDELIKDGIILCLKEIQNWAKLIDKVDRNLVQTKINRWGKELKLLLEYEE